MANPILFNEKISSEEEVLKLYQRANEYQWNPDKDIPWHLSIDLNGEKKEAWIELIKIFYGLELMGLLVINNMMNSVSEKLKYRNLPYYLSIQATDEARHIYCLEKYLQKLGSPIQESKMQKVINALGKLASKGFFKVEAWSVSTLFSENFASHFMMAAIEKEIDPLATALFKRILADEARHIGLQHILCKKIAEKRNPFKRFYLKTQSYFTFLLTALGIRQVTGLAEKIGLNIEEYLDSLMNKFEKQEETLGLSPFISPLFQRKILNNVALKKKKRLV